MNGGMVIFEKPNLQQPSMVVGFSGWLDGGEASTGTVEYLIKKLSPKPFASIPVDDYGVFQVPGIEVVRPHVKTRDGVVEEVSFPKNELFYWKKPRSSKGSDLILLLGTEPNTRWQDYIRSVINLALEFRVKRLFSFGGVLAKAPHTKEPIVSCSVSDAKLKEVVSSYAVQFSNYEGPATFNSAVVAACKEKGIDAIHMTARALYYPEFNIAVPHNPKVIFALVRRLNRLLNLKLDLSDLEQESRELEDRLNSLVSQSAPLRDYVRELEESYQELRFEDSAEAAPEDLIKGVEEFLRRQRETDDS